ncbi:MAG: threonine synthase [Armatimonadetes bacterium]|nr:threonine synthase [Armatimonadota bacterium]
MTWRGVIEEYAAFLPVSPETPRVTLLEGNTPLVPAVFLGKNAGVSVHLKIEGMNPTGSFKDRGMALAVAKALEEGKSAVLCASTGNTAASAAAYAARTGLRCWVVLPEGKVALGKVAQAVVYGAQILQVPGDFDSALKLVRQAAERLPIALVNSVNPYRIEGQKTASFEVTQALGHPPEALVLPVGNAGNITAYWKGFTELARSQDFSCPRMCGIQAEGAAPLVKGARVSDPETVATAIRIGNPASWDGAVRAAKDSGGTFQAVSDQEILAAYRILADKEGIFAEPASAAAAAGFLKLVDQGYFRKGARVVIILTGHGLKDPERAMALSPQIRTIPANLEALEGEIGSGA